MSSRSGISEAQAVQAKGTKVHTKIAATPSQRKTRFCRAPRITHRVPTAAFIIAFLFAWNELLFAIVLTAGTPAQTLSPTIIGFLPIAGALNPRNSMFAAASMLSVVPPLVFAAIFQRYITGLNIVDPVTVGQD